MIQAKQKLDLPKKVKLTMPNLPRTRLTLWFPVIRQSYALLLPIERFARSIFSTMAALKLVSKYAFTAVNCAFSTLFALP